MLIISVAHKQLYQIFQMKPLLMMALNNTTLQHQEMQGILTHGEHFVSCFEATLVPRFLKEPQKFMEILEQLLSTSVGPQHLSLLTSLLKSNHSLSPPAKYVF